MKTSLRMFFTLGCAASFAGALYACSSSDSGSTPATTTDSGTTDGSNAADSGGSDGSNNNNTGDSGQTTDSGSDSGSSCADMNKANVPAYTPQACHDCVAAKCCSEVGKCYAASPADAGLDGSNGTKTTCQLFGECEDACNGDALCSTQCGLDYGTAAETDWTSVDDCVHGTGANQCGSFCN